MSIGTLGLQDIVLDISTKLKQKTFRANESDTNARGLSATIKNNGAIYDCTGVTLRFRYIDPITLQAHIFDFEPISAPLGTFKMAFPSEMIRGNGGKTIKCTIVAEDSTSELTFENIYVYVNMSEVDSNGIEASNEYSTLRKALNDVQAVEIGLGNINPTTLANAVTLANTISVAESDRDTNEGTRNINENTRTTNEVAREVAEANRNVYEAYNVSKTYKLNNKVTYLGSSYLCIQATTGGIAPTDVAYWLKIVSKGDQGIQGVQGIKGDKGDTGAKGDTGLKGDRGETFTYTHMSVNDKQDLVSNATAQWNPEFETKYTALETEYATDLTGVKSQLAETQSQFQQVIANATVDSEVINARNSGVKGKTFTTLDERLEEIESGQRLIYGVRRTLNATSPVLTRLYDSVGKIANVPTDDVSVQNDFDNIYPWSHIKECKRDGVGRIHYKGDAGYNAVIGDWLVEIPKFYIKMERTATTFDRLISSAKHIGFWCPQAFKSNGIELDKIYVGRFKTGKDGAVDVSRPGIYPENFRDLASFRVGAKAKGVGWQLIDLSYKTEVLDMLYLIESGTFNSQAYLGNGLTTFRYVATDLAQIAETAVNRIVITNAMATNYNVGESICIGTTQGNENIAFDRTITAKNQLDATNTEIIFDGAPVNIAVGNVLWQGAQKQGQTVDLAKPNGKLSGVSGRTSNKYRGMEDIFGNVYEWVDGVLISERVAKICRDPAKYASTLTADYKPANYVNLATDGYPLEMGFDSNFPEALFPITAGGGTTTGLCDYYYQNAGLRSAYFGGAANPGSFAGLFCWNLAFAPSGAFWHIGSRFLFKPPVA